MIIPSNLSHTWAIMLFSTMYSTLDSIAAVIFAVCLHKLLGSVKKWSL